MSENSPARDDLDIFLSVMSMGSVLLFFPTLRLPRGLLERSSSGLYSGAWSAGRMLARGA
jgi:hypothetical protein